MDLFLQLGLALAAGLLIGVERGWHEREAEEGRRVAGIRTFGLIGFLGGLWGLLSRELGDVLLGFSFFALTAVLIIAYAMDRRADRDIGITTAVAALVVFSLGVLTVRGFETIAAGGAVITATLLSLKPVLHRWLRGIEAQELYAALKLLLISVVLLPVLPNRGFGPWQALNPHEIWWLVVLIAGISFAGYLAMKIAGTRRGILLTGLFGGTVSSTAVTLSFSKMGRQRELHRVLSAGVLVACATMFPRILIEVAVVCPSLLPSLALPMVFMGAAAYGGSVWLWRYREAAPETGGPPLRNPVELFPAVQFGLILAMVMLLAEALRTWLGDTGIYVLSAASGISDVDAITLSVARLAGEDLAHEVATRAIVLAAVVNTLVKGGMVVAIAGGRMAKYVVPSFLATTLMGAVSLLLV